MPTTPQASAPRNAVFLDPSLPPSTATFALLSRPASFVPAPSRCPHSLIRRQVLDFVRKLQWSAALPSSNPPPPRLGPSSSSRWPPRDLVPKGILRRSSRILGALNSLLSSPHFCFRRNLSEVENKELDRLRCLKAIVRPSDKGGKWTILPRSHYHEEALRQLSNPNFYDSLSSDPTPHVERRLRQLISHLHDSHFITSRELNILWPPSQRRTRRFYLLPKLHKALWPSSHMPPGRPIVSDVGSPSRKCSDLVNFFLLPLCTLQPSFLRDSGHLIALLRSLETSEGDLLFSMDVESLYTNIPTDEGIEAVAAAFRLHPSRPRPDLTLLTLLRTILTSNTFAYEDGRWLQTSGVAMGNPFGGAFANLFMASWEQKALASFSLKPKFWKRYQDDVFGIWPHGEPSLRAFHAHLNAQHPNIRLSLDFGSSVNFLDLRIHLAKSSLDFSLFSKPTDSHLILPPSSHHPPHTFRGVVYSEILRFATHSSSRSAFDTTFSGISPVWRSQGYSRSLIRSAKQRALACLDLDSTWTPGMFPCYEASCATCPHIICASSFRGNLSGTSFPINGRFTCDSRQVVYLLRCSSCGASYVGETDRRLKDRLAEHLRSFTRRCRSHLTQHFTTTCSPNFLTVLCIDRSTNLNRRRSKEARWIRNLNTLHPLGLNTVSSSARPSTNLILPFSTCSARLANTVRRICGPVPMRTCFTKDRNLRELFS